MEAELEARCNYHTLATLAVSYRGRLMYLYTQSKPGIGRTVYLSRPVVGNEPFAVLLADDLL
jgi:UTP-glucose-1-phosphate uridylyltransferase